MLHYAMKRKIRGDKKEIAEKESVAIKLMEKGILDLTPSTMNELVRYDRTFGNEKMTQLMYNISRGNKELAKQLIEAEGIDLNKKDDEGITAYGYAVHKKYNDLTDIMESKVRYINKNEKIEKDFLRIKDKTTAMLMLAGGIMAEAGILVETTETGELGYELEENVVLNKLRTYVRRK